MKKKVKTRFKNLEKWQFRRMVHLNRSRKEGLKTMCKGVITNVLFVTRLISAIPHYTRTWKTNMPKDPTANHLSTLTLVVDEVDPKKTQTYFLWIKGLIFQDLKVPAWWIQLQKNFFKPLIKLEDQLKSFQVFNLSTRRSSSESLRSLQ